MNTEHTSPWHDVSTLGSTLRWSAGLWAAATSIAAASWLVVAGEASPRADDAALECQVSPRAGGGKELRVVNTAAQTLPRGARISWVALGTPMPEGEVHRLPRPLTPGERMALNDELPPATSACRATVLDER